MRAGAGGRALTRDASKAALPAGVDVVEGDLTWPESLPGALDGVPAVFLFAAPGRDPGSSGIERGIRASHLTWTILRPGVFAANALVWRHQLKGADTVRGPYAGAATAPVHEADIADVAVAALTEDGHTGAVHELTWPQSLTFVDQHMPPPIVDTLLSQWAGSVGRSAPTTDTVERITGRPARTFARWAADHVADFR